MNKKGRILIVDDNEDVLFALNTLLSSYVENVKVTTKPESIPVFIARFQPDIILLDMNFQQDAISGEEGFFWLKRILEIDPKLIVILMTAYADTDKIVQTIKMGAMDFIPKPWSKEKLLATIYAAVRLRESQKEAAILKSQVATLNTQQPVEIIGESKAMVRIFDMIEKISQTDANVLVLGENGTGKDLIARFIHNQSLRSGNVFVTIDLGSISENLFESELFGYEKGAFTDARKEKPGRLEIASGGTLFLDEIANLSLPMQAKMLTAIEKRYITRLGATQNKPINVRLISATNVDIYNEVERGNFRQDLLYRINTIEVRIPPLRERDDDIVLLITYFIQRFNQKYKKNVQGLTQDAKRKLIAYSWPGNVRELQSAVERAVIMSAGKWLKPEDFILTSGENKQLAAGENLNLKSLEQNAIEKAMLLTNGNMNKAAALLGITRYSLYRKIKQKEDNEKS